MTNEPLEFDEQLAFDFDAATVTVIELTPVVDEGQIELTVLSDPEFDGQWELRQVNDFTMRAWLARHHYLGTTVPSGGVKALGIYCPDMVALVVFATATNAWGVATKFGLTDIPGNIEIARVAVHPDAVRTTTTRAVATACRWLHDADGLHWVFSYADTGQGHHGGIYQALNAVYVGVSPPVRGWLLDGEPIHPRSVVAWLGTQAHDVAPGLALKAGKTLVKVPDMLTAKHTYILPIGPPASRAAIRRRLKPHTLPYPKRDMDNQAGGVDGNDPAVQVGSAGSIPAPRSTPDEKEPTW